MTDREKICREFHEACGGYWNKYLFPHADKCMCEDCGKIHGNPKYLHPDEVLREVMKWKDKYDFLWEIGLQTQDMYQEWVVEISYVLEPDKLLIAAHKWVVERKVAR